jgi:hypothetical protein
MSNSRTTPTPTLPRKREREHASTLLSLSHLREREHAPALLPLSRLRGRVARSSERDGWGHAASPHFSIPDRSASRTVRNDN